jgi:uncharacterized membrane protein YkvA (DUF1232 family)
MGTNDLYSSRPDTNMDTNVLQPKAKSGRRSINIFWFWIMIMFAVLYVISPIDFLPDVIPVAGWIDDVVVALTSISIALPKIIKHKR